MPLSMRENRSGEAPTKTCYKSSIPLDDVYAPRNSALLSRVSTGITCSHSSPPRPNLTPPGVGQARHITFYAQYLRRYIYVWHYTVSSPQSRNNLTLHPKTQPPNPVCSFINPQPSEAQISLRPPVSYSSHTPRPNLPSRSLVFSVALIHDKKKPALVS